MSNLIKAIGADGKQYTIKKSDISYFVVENPNNWDWVQIVLCNGINIRFDFKTAPQLKKELQEWEKEWA